MTTISIPNSGHKIGTCGWLASGLQDGSIQIKPGTSKTGKGGLWLWVNDKSYCLAIFNEFDLTETQYADSKQFGVISYEFCDDLPLTPAASEYLRSAAQEWCDNANKQRESDSADCLPTIKIETTNRV